MPEVIDAKTGDAKLLVARGKNGSILHDVYGNGNFEGRVFWTRDSKAVAIVLAVSRHDTCVVVWVPGEDAPRALELSEIYKVLAKRLKRHSDGRFVNLERSEWKDGVFNMELDADAGGILAHYDVWKGNLAD